MPIDKVPPHVISVRLNNKTKAIEKSVAQRAARAGDSTLDKLGVVIEVMSELHAATSQAITALETEILALRVMLDQRGILDFNDRDA